ncbi:MAG: hypothetical protein ACFCU6_08805, partial [Balneolaceae bacterium]
MSSSKENRGIMESNPPKAIPPDLDPTASMSFLDHLEELRWRILKGLLGLALGVVAAIFFADFLINQVILGPAR